MRDRLITYEPGQIPEAAQWNLHAEMLKAQNAGVGCWVDSTGTYVAKPAQRRTQQTRYGTMNDDFTRGGTVSCRWKKQDPDTGKATVDSGEDFDVVDVFEWWPDAKAGTKIKAVKFGSVWAMDDQDCEESL